jgi:Ig-like domain CHU_C associated
MKSSFHINRKVRLVLSKLGSLVLLLQKTPVVQWILPEARIAGSAGVGELVKWSVATVAGLGVFDSVAGATTLTQLTPSPGSQSVSATSGVQLSFTVQLTGTSYTRDIRNWTTTGTMPPGLTGAQNPVEPTIYTISGVPTQTGSFSIRIFAVGETISENSYSSTFTVNVSPGVTPPPTITKQPVSKTIAKGGRATLKVVATGSNLTYQWYIGTSGKKTKRIRGATAPTFKTPPLTSTTKYWVEIKSSTVTVNSKTATVRLR